MQTIPVAIDRLHTPLCIAAPEAKTNRETGQPCTDHTGKPIYLIAAAVRTVGHRKAAVIEISTTTEPRDIAEGTPLRIVDLDAVPWELNGYHGLAFRAAEIHPAYATRAAPTAAADPA